MRSIRLRTSRSTVIARESGRSGIQVTSAIEKKERGVLQTRFAGYDDGLCYTK